MSNSRRKSNDKTPLSFPAAGSTAGGLPEAATDTELMNEAVAAHGRNDKVGYDKILFDLKARHEPLVLNVLRAENVPPHDRDSVAALVWNTIDRIARKDSGLQGAWDPGRGFGAGCPFVPFLKTVCRSRACDYHDTMKTARGRRRRVAEAAATYGEQWQSHGGSPVKATGPKKRGGNLKQSQPPAPYRVVEAGRRMLPDALAAISERERRALELHAEGLSNEEIAAVVGTSSPTVSRDLTAAREKIRLLVETAAG